MSSFKFAKLTGGECVFDQVPSPGVFRLQEGSFWNDITQKNLLARINGITSAHNLTIGVNTTPITATNPSSAADLMELVLPTGYWNFAGRTIYLFASGVYTTAGGQTPTITIAVNVGSLGALSFVSSATTAAVTTKPWNLEGFLSVVTAGSSGTLEAHGICNFELGGGAAGSVAVSSFNDTNSAVSSALDLTAAQDLECNVIMSSSNAGNSVVQRQMIVQLYN